MSVSPGATHTKTQSHTAGIHTAAALMRLQAHTKCTSICTLPQVTFASGHCLWNTNKIVILKFCARFSVFIAVSNKHAFIKMNASPIVLVLVSTFTSLFHPSISVCPSICPSIHLFIRPTIQTSSQSFFHPSLHLCVYHYSKCQ